MFSLLFTVLVPRSGRGVSCTDFLVVVRQFGGRSFVYVAVFVGSSNSYSLLDELRSCVGTLREIFKSTFEVNFGQEDLWEVARSVIV